MSKFKTLTCVAIFAACTSVSTFAAAQVAPEMTSEAVQAVAAPKAIEMSPRSKVKRVVQPVPLQAEKTAVKRGAVYGRKVYATNVIEKKPTRFIYSGGPKDTQTPVFYSAEAAKSR